ncbi:MAG: hypothetical protein ACR2N9_05355 [Acidimicrobiia bacterium]
MKRQVVSPLERLGRWDGEAWVGVETGSIQSSRIHVIVHGWAPGMRSTVETHDGFLRVWDPEATTPDGRRFDRWFGPLAEAILRDDPDATVLAYSWIDESATRTGATRSVKSQLRTTVNGQRLAISVREALSGGQHELHLIGYSHGAKVATVAALAIEPAPMHLTILDSPDSLIPAIGGALNDLGSYLRLLSPGVVADASYRGATTEDRTETFVDTYSSAFGEPYGSGPGLGWITDVILRPAEHPIEEAPSEHAYAWAWYLESARHPENGVGYAWSPLRGGIRPPGTQLRQIEGGEDRLELEEHEEVTPAPTAVQLRSRVRDKVMPPRRLSSDDGRSVGVFWRRSGDLWMTAPVRWIEGPDDARLVLYGDRTERARSVKGWSAASQRLVQVSLGGARPGPMLVTAEVVSPEFAEVEIGQVAAVNGLILPSRTELRMWFRPLLMLTLATAGAVFTLGALRLARRLTGDSR